MKELSNIDIQKRFTRLRETLKRKTERFLEQSNKSFLDMKKNRLNNNLNDSNGQLSFKLEKEFEDFFIGVGTAWEKTLGKYGG